LRAALALRLALLALPLAAPLRAARAEAPGERLDNPELPTLDGGRARLLGAAGEVSVFVFARPGQEHSARMLREMAGCKADLAGKPVRFAVVVSSSAAPAEARAALAEAGLSVPALVDAGDALYGRLGVKLHPVVGLADREGRLAALVPYQAVNYREAVRARIRFLLGEIDEGALSRALAPPRADMPGATAASVASRDLALGRLQLERGEGEKALASARKALSLAPDSAVAHGLAARALASLRRCPEAAADVAAALGADPAEAQALAAKEACPP